MQPALFTKVFDDRSLDAAIDAAATAGYDGVEIMARAPHLPGDTSKARAEEIRTRANDQGLEIPCLATYTGGYARASDVEAEAELEAFERYLELAESLEVDLLRHGAGRPSVREATDADFERAASWLRRAADVAATYGRTIGLELHSHRLTETVESTLRLVEAVDRDNVGVIHDAGNMFIADDEYGPASIRQLGERLVHVHVKDLSRIDDASRSDAFALETGRGEEVFRRELLGEGDVEYESLFAALADAGYDGSVTVETNVARVGPEEVATAELTRITDVIDRVV